MKKVRCCFVVFLILSIVITSMPCSAIAEMINAEQTGEILIEGVEELGLIEDSLTEDSDEYNEEALLAFEETASESSDEQILEIEDTDVSNSGSNLAEDSSSENNGQAETTEGVISEDGEAVDMNLQTNEDNAEISDEQIASEDDAIYNDSAIDSSITEQESNMEKPLSAAHKLAEEFGMSIEELAIDAEISVNELLSMSDSEIAELREKIHLIEIELPEYLSDGGKCGPNLKWSYNMYTDTLTITGEGDMDDYDSVLDTPWYELTQFYPYSSYYVVINEGVTSIGDRAFQGVDGYRITIPKGVTRIGDYAFAEGDFNYINLPNGLQSIGNRAFYNCHNLYEVELPSDVKNIGDYAFAFCENLTEVSLPESATTLGNRIFFDCTGLKNAYLPNGMTHIPNGLFEDCMYLKTVQLPDSVVSIGNSAFAFCRYLNTLTLPDSVTSIGDKAFRSCTFGDFVIPRFVTSIGEDAFTCCDFRSIRMPENCTIKGNSFDDAEIGTYYVYQDSTAHRMCKAKGLNYSLIKINEITLPENEVLIDAGATYTVIPSYEPNYAKNTIKYSSSNKKIATVNSDGVIKGIKAGTATITAKGDYATAKIKVTVKNAPKKVYIEADKTVVGIGESIGVKVRYDGTAYGDYSLNSSNADIVSIDENGILHAVDAGKAIITATSYNGVSQSIEIWVKKAPSTVLLDCYECDVAVGNTTNIVANFLEDEIGVISYASLDESIAIVDASGRIQGLCGGQTQIRAEAHNGVYSDCNITVHELEIFAERSSVGIGEKLEINHKHIPTCDSEITFASSDKKIATIQVIDDVAVLTAKKTGTVKITATAANGAKATMKVTVKKKPTSIKLNSELNTIGIGEKVQITSTFSSGSTGYVTYSIAEPNECSFANIDAHSGLLSTYGEISTTEVVVVEAVTYNGKKAKKSINVTPAPSSISIDTDHIDLWQNDTFTIKPRITDGTSSRIYYNVIDGAERLTIDANGKLKAVTGQGEAIVEVSTYNSLSAQALVTLHAAPESIAFNLPYTTICVGDSLRIQETIYPENGDCVRTWSSSDKKIVSVSADGTIKGLKTGTATITLKTYNGIKKNVKITVKKKPTKGSVALPDVLGFGESVALQVKGNTGGYASVIACEVDENSTDIFEVVNGKLTAKNLGAGYVRMQLYTGKWTDWKEIKVLNAPESDKMAFVLQHAQDNNWYNPIYERRSLHVAKGDYANLKYIYSSGYAGGYTVYSTNPEVLLVDGGKVKFKTEGQASLVFEAYNGARTCLDFIINPMPEKMYFEGITNCTVGYNGFLDIMIDENEEGGILDFDYLHYSVSSSNSAIKIIYYGDETQSEDEPDIFLDSIYFSGKKVGSSKITVEFFNGKKISKTVYSEKNKADYIEEKPYWDDYSEWELCLKSVEIVSKNKVVCQFYIVNPYSTFTITGINKHNISIEYDGELIAEKYFSKIKVSCPKKSTKQFTLTFSGDSIVNTDFDLRGGEELITFDYDFWG